MPGFNRREKNRCGKNKPHPHRFKPLDPVAHIHSPVVIKSVSIDVHRWFNISTTQLPANATMGEVISEFFGLVFNVPFTSAPSSSPSPSVSGFIGSVNHTLLSS